MKVRTSETARMEITTINRFKGAAVAAVLLIAAGCGGGGGGGDSAPAAVNTAPRAASSFAITGDNYGVQTPTYLAATKSANGLVLRAAIASSMTDQEFRTVSRIDIGNPGAVSAGTYSLGGDGAGLNPFPGTLYFFNGHASTLLQTVGGTITFTSYGSNPGDQITGSFSAVLLDGNDSATPKGTYTVSGSFSFTTGSYGPILPAPVPVPVAGESAYSAQCAACHSLGAFDAAPGTGPELALKGGKLNAQFPAGSSWHQGVTLTDAEVSGLKILLNAY